MGGSFSFWRPEGEKDVAIGVGLGVLFPSLEPPRMYCTCLASWASRPPKSPLAPRSCASGTSGRGTSNEQAAVCWQVSICRGIENNVRLAVTLLGDINGVTK
ncbi:uncharacterized protein LOC106007734 isoform X4 [Heterocephalus glaber]|uniref:Uncharacterized protein LOC106007734 isoform X4 n=1 Tax=Heterocephalus glaber TaxID=10181 RepID=A0AAX6QHF6_HETGA|nr:uncharacterized protein LOC106007734 isoform X4 [Heterocephalus glaber]